MGATRLILLRHGEVDASARGRIYGDMDVALSERGRLQSQAAAERLVDRPLDAVVSSGLQRAEALARCLREPRSLKRRDEPRLKEMNRGSWAGLDRATLEARWPARWQRFERSSWMLSPPGGEAITHVWARVRRACEELAAQYPDGTVALCAHRWVVSCVAARARGWSLDRVHAVEPGYCAQIEVDWLPGRGPLAEVSMLGTPEV